MGDRCEICASVLAAETDTCCGCQSALETLREIPKDELIKLSITALPLGRASLNAANNLGVDTVGELIQLNEAYILKYRSYRRPITRISSCLRELGLSFAASIDEEFLAHLAARTSSRYPADEDAPGLEELITRDLE